MTAGQRDIPTHDVAGQLRWLKTHRLLGVAPPLRHRGLIAPEVEALAGELGTRKPTVGSRRLAEERRVFA